MRDLHLGNWLGGYGRWLLDGRERRPAEGTTHVIFLFVDHFEPAGKEPRLARWLELYPKLAGSHRDADGCPPRHSWFYPLDLFRDGELAAMRRLVDAGLGEVEFHWHHCHDSEATFREKLWDGLAGFQRHGYLLPRGNGKAGCFGFIHGNWSLNNSRGAEFCGVDGEIAILKEAGCYGDFTFPALHSASQPAEVNAIYYAGMQPGWEGYARGRRSAVGRPEGEDEFLIFTGPLLVNWRDWRFGWHPMIENGEIGKSRSHGDPTRIDAWVRGGMRVAGRPEWLFVKVFCHGGQDWESVLSPETGRMFDYLESRYNDGVNFRLHYVTAREAFNLVRAAEAGCAGDPDRYRDFAIPPGEMRPAGSAAVAMAGAAAP
ncbi:hypothetical protein L4X63_17425 [Geomonas sp. Red32]|uniref:hypothetical protein n=1 Tax=Geomonas sp. Red32 TaxID=2912856 RepID=UPI00202D0500|nr:hypothetical protein [Geomonas sp. Red32]MCM0083368.1 hypothetical protein [Geomonas sp. Red32]